MLLIIIDEQYYARDSITLRDDVVYTAARLISLITMSAPATTDSAAMPIFYVTMPLPLLMLYATALLADAAIMMRFHTPMMLIDAAMLFIMRAALKTCRDCRG